MMIIFSNAEKDASTATVSLLAMYASAIKFVWTGIHIAHRIDMILHIFRWNGLSASRSPSHALQNFIQLNVWREPTPTGNWMRDWHGALSRCCLRLRWGYKFRWHMQNALPTHTRSFYYLFINKWFDIWIFRLVRISPRSWLFRASHVITSNDAKIRTNSFPTRPTWIHIYDFVISAITCDWIERCCKRAHTHTQWNDTRVQTAEYMVFIIINNCRNM